MPASRPSKTSCAAGRPVLKYPLRVLTTGVPRPGTADTQFDFGRSLAADISGPDLRKMEISEFSDWLRTQTKNRLPFQERAIEVYAETARTLHRWMDTNGIDGDFTAVGGAGPAQTRGGAAEAVPRPPLRRTALPRSTRWLWRGARAPVRPRPPPCSCLTWRVRKPLAGPSPGWACPS